jgi:hypothetical protein
MYLSSTIKMYCYEDITEFCNFEKKKWRFFDIFLHEILFSRPVDFLRFISFFIRRHFLFPAAIANPGIYRAPPLSKHLCQIKHKQAEKTVFFRQEIYFRSRIFFPSFVITQTFSKHPEDVQQREKSIDLKKRNGRLDSNLNSYIFF